MDKLFETTDDVKLEFDRLLTDGVKVQQEIGQLGYDCGLTISDFRRSYILTNMNPDDALKIIKKHTWR